jgi:hypothetical protein
MSPIRTLHYIPRALFFRLRIFVRTHKVQRHIRLIADHPTVVPRRDVEDIASFHFDHAAIVQSRPPPSTLALTLIPDVICHPEPDVLHRRPKTTTRRTYAFCRPSSPLALGAGSGRARLQPRRKSFANDDAGFSPSGRIST